MTNSFSPTREEAGCQKSQISPPLPAWAGDQSWNIFRRKDESDLWCAVPCDHSVPPFLFSGEWKYDGLEAAHNSIFMKLKEPDARWAVQRNGFYLFMCFSRQDRINQALS